MPSMYAGSAIEHWRAAWGSGWLLRSAVIFSFFVGVLSLTLPFFILLVYDRVLNSRSEATLVALMILAIVLIVGMGILDYARRRLFARFAAELQASLDEVSHQLAESRNDAKNNLRSLNAKQKELDELRENTNIDNQMKQVKHKQVSN